VVTCSAVFCGGCFTCFTIFQAAGKWRQEGKGYEMQDGTPKYNAMNGACNNVIHDSTGDMVHFQFNVTKDPKKK
jgi:hypothetical protein